MTTRRTWTIPFKRWRRCLLSLIACCLAIRCPLTDSFSLRRAPRSAVSPNSRPILFTHHSAADRPSLDALVNDDKDTKIFNTQSKPTSTFRGVLFTTMSGLVLFCSTFHAPPASARSTSTPLLATNAATILNHDYDDPLHPQCKRNIRVDRNDPSIFHYTGTAVGSKDDRVLRGCSSEEVREFGIRRGAFDGKVLLAEVEGDKLLKIDAGDGIHVGVWEPASTNDKGTSSTSSLSLSYKDVDGIRWNDGNKWIVKNNSIAKAAGEFIFLAYIGFSTLAGFKGAYDGIQRKKEERRQQR